MKLALKFLSVAILSASVAYADWVVEYKMEGGLLNTNATMKIKGDKVRTDLATGPLGAMSTIMDTKSGDTIQLIHAQKMAMKQSGAQLQEMLENLKKLNPAAAEAAAETPKPVATGEKQTIGGHEAELYTVTLQGSTMKLWASKDYPNAAKLREATDKLQTSSFTSALGAKGATEAMAAIPGVVVKTEMEMLGQKTTMTLVSAKEEEVAATEFELPAGYQEMAAPSIPAPKPQ